MDWLSQPDEPRVWGRKSLNPCCNGLAFAVQVMTSAQQ